MSEYKTFTVKSQKGITDLISEVPYRGDSQYPYFAPYFKITEEEYKADKEKYAEAIREINEQYVIKLKESGEYGKETKTHFNFKGVDSFNDSPSVIFGKSELLIPKGIYNTVEVPKFNIKFDKED